MLHVYIDADACPVKQEVYRVAERYQLPVTLVANSWMRTPTDPRISLVVVGDAPDEADDWIAEHVEALDIVITADIPLARRCLDRTARVIGSNGRPFTDQNIGQAVATREGGEVTGGPPPMGKKDRSRFLQQLDQVIQSIRRQPGARG